MRQTSFEEFVELARRGTFVPVYKEILADLLTPVSAFLKIAELSDYAFLLERRGRRRAGCPILVSRQGPVSRPSCVAGADHPRTKRRDHRVGRAVCRRPPPADVGVPVALRSRTAAIHRRSRGIFGYDASPWFEPALRPVWERYGSAQAAEGPEAGFMLFDTVLAFDHVKHRILAIANARITPNEDLETLYHFACARMRFWSANSIGPCLAHRPGPLPRRRCTRTRHASASKRRCEPRRSSSLGATCTRSSCRSGSKRR